MIVRNFLQWVRTAPAGERAEATARAGPRLSLFRSFARRSRRRRGRDADVARRSVAAGAPGAGRRACSKSRCAAGNRFRAGRRSAEHRGAGAGAVAALHRCRSGRCGRDRNASRAGRDREPCRVAALGRRGDR